MLTRRPSPAVTADGAELRRQLFLRGLPQDELARLAGVTPSTLSGLIHGRPVRPDTFGRVARALAAVPVVELVGIDDLLIGANDPRGRPVA